LGQPALGGTKQGTFQGVDGHHFTLGFYQLSKWVEQVEVKLEQ
jgi:hypothetical protein